MLLRVFIVSLAAFSDDHINYNSLYSEAIILKGVVVTEKVRSIIKSFIGDFMLTAKAIERLF